MIIKTISSRQNAAFKRLRDLVGHARDRRAHGLAWCEGERLCATFAQAAMRTEPDARGGLPALSGITLVVAQQSVLASIASITPEVSSAAAETWVLTPALFAEISQLESPLGWALVVPAPSQPLGVEQFFGDAVILDRIQDPGNAGTILRSAAAAGFSQVWSVQGTVDLWSPKVLRAAMGAHTVLALHESCSVEGITAAAAAGGLALLAAAAQSDAVSLYSNALALHRPVAWVFGQEANGVSSELLQATQSVRIPMQQGVESLNVATAAGICLFETVRRRAA